MERDKYLRSCPASQPSHKAGHGRRAEIHTLAKNFDTLGMLVEIRKMNLDSWINKLVDVSKIKKTWYGKTIDNYWTYLNETTQPLATDFNAYIFSDLLTFLLEERGIKPGLNDYSHRLSENRGSAVFLFALDDKDNLLQQLNKESFVQDFEIFCKDLNGSYYEYSLGELSETITRFKEAVSEMDNQYGLIVNVG